MAEEAIDIRLRLRDQKTTETGLKRTGKAAGALGRDVDTAGKRAAGASRGFNLFRRNQGAVTKATNAGAGAMRKAASAALRLGIAYAGFSAAKTAVTRTVALAKATLGLERNLGLAAEQGSALAAVAQVRGIDMKQLNLGFTTLGRNLAGARAGGEKQLDMFKRLGISQDMINDKNVDTWDLLLNVADGFGNMKGGVDRARIAQGLLGKSSQALLPLFSKGRSSLTAQIDLANKYGATLAGKPLKSMADLIAVQREMQFAQLGFQVQFATKIAPALVTFTRLIIRLVEGYRSLSPAIQDVAKLLGGALLGLSLGRGSPWLALVGALVVGALLIKKHWGAVSGVFERVRDVVMGGLRSAFEWLKRTLHISTGDLKVFGQGIKNYVLFWVKIITTYFKIWGGVAKWLFLTILWPIAKRAFAGIKMILQGFALVFGGIIKLVGGLLTGDWKRAWAGAKQIVRGAIKLIIGIIRTVTAPIRAVLAFVGRIFRSVFGGIWGGVKSGATAAWKFVTGKLTGMAEGVRRTPGRIAAAARGMFDGIKDAFRSAINWVIRGWNSLQFKIPGFDPPGPGPKFGGFTLGLPDINELGFGSVTLTPGPVIVGDRGQPELLDLPAGARVRPLTPSERATPGAAQAALSSAVSGAEGRPVVARFYLNGRQIAEAVGEAVDDRRARR